MVRAESRSGEGERMSDIRFETPDPRMFPSEEMSGYRKACNAYRFWRVCGKECRRKRACGAANPRACFLFFWKHVAEEEKVKFRAAIKARHAGHSIEASVRMSEEAAVRWKAMQASLSPLPLAGVGKNRVNTAR
jgi:hypothetical protein